MNTNAIKRYAPKARTAFIAAMSKRAALLGIRESSVPSLGIAPLEINGDLALISDSSGTQRAFPASIARPRAALAKRVEQLGFAQTMEQAAYSWFNRLCALRFMEIKGYLDHGRRVLSAADGSAGMPQILEDCLDIELEGLDKARITELKLDGNKDEELYRELLLAQCHALHQAMPFLFEAVDDALELLLPDNLAKTDSLIRELVAAIPEEDWQDVEIIGWLYQFYISEKRDQVIGKVVKSEDIPAATQLFTPNWIVQYLVQNSLGRQWLLTYPGSPLKDKMPYYVASGAQPPEVQAQLAASTPESIDPQSLKVLDPACGSGHILVEAYKLLKEIYIERGFRSRDIPQLILENNLFGLDIDDRAGQLAGFALMMLAREDDRRIFSRELKLNVLALQESRHLDLAGLWRALNLASDWQRGQSQGLFDSEQGDLAAALADNRYQLLKATLARFTEAKTFGSLIEVPAEDVQPLGELLEQLRQLAGEGDSIQKPAARTLLPYVQQAWILALRYDAVAANPPYLGGRGVTGVPPLLAPIAKSKYSIAKIDAYAMFILRARELLKAKGIAAFVVKEEILYLPSLAELRSRLLINNEINTIWRIGSGAFSVRAAALTFSLRHDSLSVAIARSDKSEPEKIGFSANYNQSTFARLPFSIIDENIKPHIPLVFDIPNKFSARTSAKQGMSTTDNERFLRYWWEIESCQLSLASESKNKKWHPYNKGGSPRKWYGNVVHVVDYEQDGQVLIDYVKSKYPKISDPEFVIRNRSSYFKKAITWSRVRSSGKRVGFRISEGDQIFDTSAMCVSHKELDLMSNLAFLNSSPISDAIQFLSPGTDFNSELDQLPICPTEIADQLRDMAEWNCGIAKQLWNKEELSMSFSGLNDDLTKTKTFSNWVLDRENELETSLLELNKTQALIDRLVYGCLYKNSHELNIGPTYPVENMEYEINSTLTFINFFIGCVMGRYSLDKPGLILASQGETLQDYLRQIPTPRFTPDDDAVLPLTDQEWFTDDTTNRFREFVRVVWGDEHLQENLDFVAESLCLHAIKPKRGESSLDTIRRYMSTQFFKDHLRTYKRRPIYWLFSSGKHKAFECLVYLHRYNEGTLARMRTEYVIPLTAKLSTYAAKLEKDLEASTSTAEKKRIEKELTTVHNQQAELATFDEKLRHYADQRISLDLDDGVKVNYGKFGDLLAEVKAVTGGASE